MRNIFTVAAREYSETVRTKTFLLGMAVVPVIIGGMIFLSMKIQTNVFTGEREDRHVAVAYADPALHNELDDAFTSHNHVNSQQKILVDSLEELPADSAAYADKVKRGGLDAFIMVEGTLGTTVFANVLTVSERDIRFVSSIRSLINKAVANARYESRGISPDLVAELSRPVAVDVVDLTAADGRRSNEVVMIMTPFVFMFLMFFGIFTVGQRLLQSVIEEKSSRVIEVLVSVVSPFELMAGKILGQSAVGLTLVGVYMVALVITAVARGMTGLVDPLMAAYFIAYYIPGFVLTAAVFAAVGSASNDIKDAQHLMMPLTFLFMSPMFAWMPISQDPTGVLATVMSFIPPLTPLVMILRLAVMSDPPMLQVAGSFLLLLVSVPAVIWLSAKVFRTGILMYGKTPTPAEIVRWIRYG